MALYRELCNISNVQQLHAAAQKLWDPMAQLQLMSEMVEHRVLVKTEQLLIALNAWGDDELSDLIASLREQDPEEIFCVHMLQLMAFTDVSLANALEGLIDKLAQ